MKLRVFVCWLVLAAAAAAQSPPVPTDPDELRIALTRWIAGQHQALDYGTPERKAGGAALGMKLIADLDRVLGVPEEPPPPSSGELPEPTWTATPSGTWTRLEDGATFAGRSVEDWQGSDRNSTASRNRQAMPGWVPGAVAKLDPGLFPNWRWTRSFDVDVEAVKANPVRLGDPVRYPDRPFTYWTPAEGLRLGLNDRDRLKGRWAWPTPATEREPAFPAWFRWGLDPQTWVIGSVGADGRPTTIIGGGRTYGESIGAASFANLIFRGPTGNGSAAILQVENPVAFDEDGNKLPLNWPEDRRAVNGEWQGFRDVELVNCWIEGEWSFETASGLRSKWGMLSYELGRSSRGENVPGFSWRGGGVGGIAIEHCFYKHNTRAVSPTAWAVLLSGLELGPAGRTAVQCVSRTGEGPDGQGRIVLEDLTIRDVCLEQGGGGSALTFAGNHDGRVEIRRVDCRLGANPRLAPEYQANITGGFVSHAGGGSEGRPTREIVIEASHFQTGPAFVGAGAARRPNLQVGAVGTFRLLATSVHQYAGAREAIAFDLGSIAVLELDAQNDIRGAVRWGAKNFADQDADGDGLLDGDGWRAFVAELRDGLDGDGDGQVEDAHGLAVSWR